VSRQEDDDDEQTVGQVAASTAGAATVGANVSNYLLGQLTL